MFPELRIAIGHFGMVTREGWLEQIKLAKKQKYGGRLMRKTALSSHPLTRNTARNIIVSKKNIFKY